MNRFAKTLILAIMLLVIPLKQWAQQPQTFHSQAVIAFDITEIDLFEERVFFMHHLINDSRFDVIVGEEDGIFIISGSDAYEGLNLTENFATFREQNTIDFQRMDKEQAAEVAAEYKGDLPNEFTSALMMDYYIRSRQNNTCANADPFCTDNGMYEFPAGVNAGSGETGPYYDCLYTQPNPAWYYMRILNPGNIDIYMYSTPSKDIDFCCWGPFTDPITPCPNGLTSNKVVSCSYSINATEHCLIPSSAQTGDYFILVITNYSNQTCNINFSKVAGTGTTDCGILPPLVENDGPYCVGETIHLTANGQAGATYNWTGPGNFTSTQQNPTRPNCTMAMAGTYTCTIAVGNQTNSATTEVVIYPQPTANFTFTTVCAGEATQFTSTSTTNPSGQQITGYLWDFGDGQTSTQQNPSHQYSRPGDFTVTLTVSCSRCVSTQTQSVTVHAAPVANAGPDQTIAYGSTAQLSGSGGSGTFNFHWEPANMVTNANAQNTQTVPLTQDQTYTLTVTNPQGQCTSSDEVTIHINGSAMTVNATANPSSICQGGSTQLVANAGGGTGNFTYSWTPTTGLSNPNIYNPIASPSQTTTYTCHVSDGQTSQDVSVTVTVNDVIVEDEYMTICPSDVYHWHGSPYTETGTYQFDTVTSQGCNKTIYLHLDHYPSYNANETPSVEVEICDGESYTFHAQGYNDTYTHSIETSYTLQTIHGCDSIVRLNLTVWPEQDTTIRLTLCPEMLPYNFYGVDYYDETDVTVLDTDMHGCDSSVRLVLTIRDHYEPPTAYRYVGYYDNPSYNWYIPEAGATLTYTEDGTYTETLTAGACEGIFTLDLHFLQIPEPTHIFDTVCDSYPWIVNGTLVGTYHESCIVPYSIPLCYEPNNLNTQFMYYDPNNLNNPIPCTEDYVLHLVVNHKSVDNVVTIDLDSPGHEDDCDEYLHSDPYLGIIPFHNDTINALYTGQTDEECEYKVRINIKNMQYTPQPEIYCPDNQILYPNWPITATEFNVNAYTYRVKDKGRSDMDKWDKSHCKWEINKPSWRLVPNPDDTFECKVYAMDWVPDSICLSFKAVNSCSGNEGVIAEYWLHPSFYGVEEQEAYPASVSVIPNPNNGQMRLQFDNMQGDLNIKVYGLTGTLFDAFELKSVKTGEAHDYSMKRLMNGVYFFNISDGKRSVTKKVVIIQ